MCCELYIVINDLPNPLLGGDPAVDNRQEIERERERDEMGNVKDIQYCIITCTHMYMLQSLLSLVTAMQVVYIATCDVNHETRRFRSIVICDMAAVRPFIFFTHTAQVQD